MMRVLVIAANGRTGREVVTESLKREHDVTAFIRGKYKNAPEGIKIIEGDATNKENIIEAIKDADTVISTIGHVRKSPDFLQTRTIENCIIAIESTGNTVRLVSLTGSGVRVKSDKITLIDRLLNLSIKIIDSQRVNDGIEHFNSLKKSNINWSVLRVLKLTNSKKKDYKLSENGPVMTFSSRKTVASALVDLAETEEWNRKAPLISKP